METQVKTQFGLAVEKIFNNWSALQLAIDHGMGSPQMGQQFQIYMTDFCCDQNNFSVEDIEDTIIDILEEQFHTECEDESPKTIAVILFKLISFLKMGQLTEFQAEFEKLHSRPTTSRSLTVHSEESKSSAAGMEVESSEESEVEEGWTKVTQKKKSGR